ncbi:hypothetical protein BC936DRAFT_149813 [Jimgerdemannia flammicorona]|uniref:Oxysterol-binding protein n=1 Tax=Jimgerdemannia flammicorona TaxID=994334 RepID=A0A433D058_9FUNG|nr:hypothetical protein BC936DRAFT_149813 [Jimgerdemannia flammicorona]
MGKDITMEEIPIHPLPPTHPGGQKSKFKGTSIKVEQIGRATLHLLHPSETYIVTFPDLYIRSLFTGSPFLELSGTSSIVSSTGCVASLEFVSKPWFKGEHHHIKGSVCNAAGKETHTITGRWNSVTHFTAVGSGKQQLLFDAEASPMAARVTAPVEQQDRLETHRLWGGVTAALRERNYSAANAEKNRIEEGQRLEKKEREMKGETWAPALFAFEADKESENEEEARMRKQAKATSSIGGGLDIGGWLYKESMHLKQ